MQTCKHLALLATTRRVWLDIVCNLPIEQSPDILPHQRLTPDALPLSSLREIATNAARGCLNWRQAEGPAITCEEFVEFEEEDFEHHLSHDSKVVLLPGGDYLFSKSRQGLACYRVEDSKCIWRQVFLFDDGYIRCPIDCDYQLLDDEDTVMIVVCVTHLPEDRAHEK